MKLFRTLSISVALAGASTAAFADKAPAKPAEKPAPPAAKPADTVTPAEAAKVEKFFNELVDAMVKHQNTCKNMAVSINALFDKNEGWLMKAAESGKELPQTSKDKMAKRQNEMMGAAMKCKDDADVVKAMQRFAAIGAAKKKS